METWIKNISDAPLEVQGYVAFGWLVVPAVIRLAPGEGAWIRTKK